MYDVEKQLINYLNNNKTLSYEIQCNYKNVSKRDDVLVLNTLEEKRDTSKGLTTHVIDFTSYALDTISAKEIVLEIGNLIINKGLVLPALNIFGKTYSEKKIFSIVMNKGYAFIGVDKNGLSMWYFIATCYYRS